MSSSQRVFEKDLYEIWTNRKFEEELKTHDGVVIEVLDSGHQNSDTAGPDFHNARIRIGNLTFVGDIEIDTDYNDWKTHGHHLNNKYNKVVLHASLTNKFNQPYVYTKDGRKVPSIKLANYVNLEKVESIVEKVEKYNENHKHNLKCVEGSPKIEKKIKENFVVQLGTDRFKKKCKKFYERLKELKYIKELNIKEPVINYELSEEFRNKKYSHEDFKDRDLWLQLLYENVFEALGYSKNKSIMLKLAQSVNIEFLSKITNAEDSVLKLESVLFGISGLLPDADKLPSNHTSEYTRSIYAHWNKLITEYDGNTFNETDWNFFRLRPQNFPTVRIAGGALFLDELLNKELVSNLIKKIKEIRNLNVLINSLRSTFVIRSHGYWQDHYVFDKEASNKIKYFVGAGRADEIVINVILPFFVVYFEVFGNQELAKKVYKIFNVYSQKTDNRIVREVAETLKLEDDSKKTVYSQGMIELFRHYCSKDKCSECEIGKVVFT